MIDYIVEAIRLLMKIWDLFSDEQKERATTHVADGFDGIFRKFFRAATDEANPT